MTADRDAVSSRQVSEVCFVLPEAEGTDPLAQLEEHLSLGRESEQTSRATYFDTFDWRLFRAGHTLRTEGTGRDQLWTWSSLGGEVRSTARHAQVPGMASSLPPGAFGELAPLLSMRRLLPLATVLLRSTALRQLDDERKTVVRLWLEHGSVKGQDAPEVPLAPRLRVRSVRGYRKAFDQLVEILSQTLGFEADTTPDLVRLATAVGRQPGDYTSKPNLQLDPEQTAGEATQQILRTLLATMEVNYDGTRNDLDSEFLHDFRVAIRRTRSALSQIKRIFAAEKDGDPGLTYRRHFGWLGSITGPTRDLDVYLLKFGSYEAALPEEVRQDLQPLHRFLVAEQRREQRRLAKTLGLKSYHTVLDRWRAFLDDPSQASGVNSQRPVREVASERIWKIYRRIVKRGRKAINHQSPAEELHDLRIECKKLRYLLEFFRSLYDPKVASSIKDLKRLQDNLGDFNDYEVQRHTLTRFAGKLFDQGKTPVETFLAMGRLQAHLEAGQETERQRFAECFARFTEPDKQQRFRTLFGPT